MKFNETLKELFVADNKLTPSDGVQLGSLLKTNHTLALLDLRNNLLQVGCDESFVSYYVTATEIFLHMLYLLVTLQQFQQFIFGDPA